MKDTQIIPDADTELGSRIEDTRTELMLALLNGCACKWLPPFWIVGRARRIAERAIDYIYFEE